VIWYSRETSKNEVTVDRLPFSLLLKPTSLRHHRVFVPISLCVFSLVLLANTTMAAEDALERKSSWQQPDANKMDQWLRQSLDALGILPAETDTASVQFMAALGADDADPLDAFVAASRAYMPVVEQLASLAESNLQQAGRQIDPSNPSYIDLESLPKPTRMSVRTWLSRELIRARLYDEALPAIAEVEPEFSIDPAATLFFRGVCYHALLKKEQALTDLRRLLENEKNCPIRFSRTAHLMVADIKPLKEDSLDEISRIMTDVTRRLDLGRTDERVKDQEQKIIDKLSKLIEKIEEQQQQQQQQQQSSQGQGGNQDGQSSPMNESQIAGGGANGDVDRKNIEDRDGWGKLPPAERQQALQQISRDLPTHYREAIEAYFRKLATDGS
jgi:tetratricopeptide (TPR) repeat protein